MSSSPQHELVKPAQDRHDHSRESSALDLTLRALRPLLANPEVTELCINRPGEAFVELRTGWRREALPFADFDWCLRLDPLERPQSVFALQKAIRDIPPKKRKLSLIGNIKRVLFSELGA